MPTRILLRLFFLIGLAPLCAFALGVGQLEVRSALNQNFDAELPLIVNNPAELTGLAVRIPRQEDFNRAGVERLELLSKLRFSVQTPPGGRSVVKLTSVEPIREPNFNLLLELVWPRGRLIREFTVQLDPELYANRRPPPLPPLLPPPVARPQAVAPPVAVAPVVPQLPPAPPVSFEGASLYGPIKVGETLAAVANRVRPSTAISLRQMMAILMAGNPAAFANGNPNALRTGTTLKVPTSQALSALLGAPAATPSSPELAAASATPRPVVAPAPAEASPPGPPAASGPEPVSPPPPPVSGPVVAAPPASPLPGAEPGSPPPTSPTEPLGEIVPQAAIPRTPAPPAAPTPAAPAPEAPAPATPPGPVATSTAPTAPEPAATPGAATTPATPVATAPAPAAAPPPLAPPAEAESSWMSNLVLWAAIALMVLAIAAVILLPLLRRRASTQSSALAEAATPASAEAASAPVSAITQIQEGRPRSGRPRPAVELAATALAAAPRGAESPPSGSEPVPKPIEELLKDFDFGLGAERTPPAPAAYQGVAPALNIKGPLFETEPPTASSAPRPANQLADTPKELPDQAKKGEEMESPARLQAGLPSELRLDGLDFDFGDFGLDKAATRPQPSELPPLEMKPVVSEERKPFGLPLLELGAMEPPTEPPSLAPPVAPPAAAPAMGDLKFEFTDVTQELAKYDAQEESLRLSEALALQGSGDQAAGDVGGAPTGAGEMDIADYVETKLDLAAAYLEMGDQIGARGLLEEVLREGGATQQERAEELLKKLS